MKPFLLLIACSILSLSACTQARMSASHEASLAASQAGTTYAEMTEAYGKAPLRFARVTLSCKIVSPEKVEELPDLVLRSGRTGRTNLLKTIQYPVDFAFPRLPEKPKPGIPTVKEGGAFSSFPVTPSKPTKFASAQVGWKLNAKLTRRKSFLMISGTLTEKKEGARIQAAGIPFEPIVAPAKTAFGGRATVVISENRAERPIIETREIPILIAAQHNEVYRVYLDAKRTTYAEFQCKAR